MTEPAFKAALAAAVLALLAAPAAAQAKADKGGNKGIKSRCTVLDVVVGTGWDIFGSSKCSMFNDKPAAGKAGAKPQGSPQATGKGKRD